MENQGFETEEKYDSISIYSTEILSCFGINDREAYKYIPIPEQGVFLLTLSVRG